MISSPLQPIEPKLRSLLPADLYAAAWIDPSQATLIRVFEHLRALQHTLSNYIASPLPRKPDNAHRCQPVEGALMFTDLAGFTSLMEANAAHGRAGAEALLAVLNDYFDMMIEIIGKSGGTLLEFTGDALLVQFPCSQLLTDATAQAVRTGLRMQRAMIRHAQIDTPQGTLSLGMRIGIHTGRFLTATIGTPLRMEYVLLGETVRQTKLAEGAGKTGRVCLTDTAYRQVKDLFRFKPGPSGYHYVVDILSTIELGGYELVPNQRRPPRAILLDRSIEGLVTAIEQAVDMVEPLASYLPMPVLNLLVESAARRRITPDFAAPTVVFVNLIGLSESASLDLSDEENKALTATFSRAFAFINAAVESRGGILKKVTYHLSGSDIMILFGVPNAHTDDPVRAARAALAIREIMAALPHPTLNGQEVPVRCTIGLAQGPAFAAEIGALRARREFNVLGDVVNTAARLMAAADTGQILITEAVYQHIAAHFECESLGPLPLKGKKRSVPVYALHGSLDDLAATTG
ncbi:MAG: adenylate/guanylate cyclase domain-containing protein [Anaerolineae bacterium]|nr:adenylate/guanylate cyclase domain-containing protein [Anaerolineae bacterium]